MLRQFLAAILFAVTVSTSTAVNARPHRPSAATAPVASGSLQLFATEAAAQSHCPRDVVVWLNMNSGINHERGMRWYGNTKAGANVCKAEADGAGDRDTRNGQ